MADPYISVIVTAYNRRQYLPEALRSLERQTLDRSKFEVVVVKNFEDPKSDEIIRRNGWRWVYSDEAYQGRFLAAGVEEAGGDIITFLEDDDLYVPERLAEVRSLFGSGAGVTYFHNAAKVLYGTGAEGPTVGALELRASPGDLSLRALARSQMDFNLSSMSAVGDALSGGLSVLRGVKKSVDTAVFVLASRRAGLLVASPRPLTLYRVHTSSTSATGLIAALEPLEEWARRYADSMKAYAEDYLTLAAAAGRGPVRDWLEWRAAAIGLTLGALRGLGGSRPSARDYLTALWALMRGIAPPKLAVAGALGWFLPLSLRRPLIEARRRSLRAQLGLQG